MPLPPPPGSNRPGANPSNTPPPPHVPRDKRELGEHVLRLLEETHRNSVEAVARTRWLCDALTQHGVPRPKFDVRKIERDIRRGTEMFREIRDAFFPRS